MRKQRAGVGAIIGLMVGSGFIGYGSIGLSFAKAENNGTIHVVDYMSPEPQNSAYNKVFGECQVATGYKIRRLIVPQGQLIIKVTQLAAGGTTPDLVVADGDQLPTLADEGLLQPLDLARIGVRSADFIAGPYSAGTYGGKQYALPIGSNGEIIVYNKTMLAQAGISSPPKSWSELAADAHKLTTKAHYGFAVTLANGEVATWNFLSQLWSNGGTLQDLTSPQAVQAMDFWTSMVKSGSAPQASLNWQSTDIEAEFADGKLAMAQIGTWELPTLIKDAASKDVRFGQAPQVSATGSTPVTPFGGEVLAIGKDTTGDKLQAVNKCLSIFQSPANLLALDKTSGYVPDFKPVVAEFLRHNPAYETLYNQLQTSRSRTAEVGAHYNAYSSALFTAIQAVATGQEGSKAALAGAAATAKGV
jgi:multiple sugar transport system substrate-binding protein